MKNKTKTQLMSSLFKNNSKYDEKFVRFLAERFFLQLTDQEIHYIFHHEFLHLLYQVDLFGAIDTTGVEPMHFPLDQLNNEWMLFEDNAIYSESLLSKEIVDKNCPFFDKENYLIVNNLPPNTDNKQEDER